MPDRRPRFAMGTRVAELQLDFDLDARLDEWSQLRKAMARRRAPEFTRDEWAYLMSFIERHSLEGLLDASFGPRSPSTAVVDVAYRPRTPAAVWLPSNVSLLGPLVMVMLTLTGAEVQLKAGSAAEDLTAAFLHFARGELAGTALGHHLSEAVSILEMDRSDPRNEAMARAAHLRIAFGSDEAITGIDRLPHPPGSVLLGFGDRQSEAWLDTASAKSTEVIETLVRVFAIYGQAGCTSPRRVVVIDGTEADARALRDRILDVWASSRLGRPDMAVASENLMVRQWAAATGWDAALTTGHGAVVAAGAVDLPPPSGRFLMTVVAADVATTLTTLPPNIQTVGHALQATAVDDALVAALAARSVARIVRLGRMHHFGVLWDGYDVLRSMFSSIEVDA